VVVLEQLKTDIIQPVLGAWKGTYLPEQSRGEEGEPKKKTKAMLAALSFLLITACNVEPETIIQTVEVPSTVKVPVTLEITRLQIVTRLIEVTKGVIHEIEVTREVPVEVSRTIETIVTATPEPTTEPTATALVQQPEGPAPAPKSEMATALLVTIQATSEDVGQLIGIFDNACYSSVVANVVNISCRDVVTLNDEIFNAPTYDVSGSSQEVQEAYRQYRWAIQAYANGGVGLLVEDCRTHHADEGLTEISALTGCGLSGELREPRDVLNSSVRLLQNFIEQ